MATSSNVSEKEVAAREECLESLSKFIDGCQETITSMLDSLGWTPEHFMQPRSQSLCPYDKNHRMSKSSLEKHIPVCEVISQGYSREEAEQILEDRSYFYKDAGCIYTVKPDLETLNSVLWNHHVQNHSVFYGYKKVPQTSEEEYLLMSREDRLAMAEYIIRRAKEANRLKELGQDELLVAGNLKDLIKKENEERQLDPVEEMAALRDYRRRRQTYRAKNVHITKKSHTEIMREVINNQMEMYAQSVKEETGLVEEQKFDDEKEIDSKNKKSRGEERREREDKSRYRRSRRRSRSRSRSRDRSARSSRRSRSKSEDRDSRIGKHERDKRSERSSVDDRSVRGSRHRSRSGSEKREVSKYNRKHRSRSRSASSERSKKPKHKKHKHKHKKHRKSEKRGEDRESDGEREDTAGDTIDKD